MSRFARVDGLANYSEAKPQNFDAADPEFIHCGWFITDDKGEIIEVDGPQPVRRGGREYIPGAVKRRAIDEPPTPASRKFENRRPVFANAGHKRR